MRRPTPGIAAPAGPGNLTGRAIDLPGPASQTLAPPPTRRTGVLATLSLAALVFLGLAALAAFKPALFVTAVQAFVGRF